MTAYVPPAGSIPTLHVPSVDDVRSVHLIGIGGAGMRNLARLFLARGIAVSGSDLKASRGLDELRALGAAVAVGHHARQVGEPDAVVVSSAIGENNSELVAARSAGIPVWARAQALAGLAAGRRSVAVAGTHGKSTTTSMLGLVLERANLDPTYLVGGDLNESGSGARAGDGDLFVYEADESDGSFLLGAPSIGIVTNVEVDHVDFYPGGQDEIDAAFAAFAERCELLVVCADDPGVGRLLERTSTPAVKYGIDEQADLILRVTELGPGGARGEVRIGSETPVPLSLRIDGAHNLLNAVAAIAAARALGVEPAAAADTLASFGGVHRRFELRGSARGADFFDDYGHVPREMAVTLDVARRREPERLIALVQPHRFSRVQAMWRELGASVSGADVVIVTDVYGAAQPPIPGVTGKLVVDGVTLSSSRPRVVYLPHRTDVVTFLEREVRRGDLVVTMGCGDVWMLGDAAVERIRESDERAPGRARVEAP